MSQSSWFSCSPKKNAEEAVVEPALASESPKSGEVAKKEEPVAAKKEEPAAANAKPAAAAPAPASTSPAAPADPKAEKALKKKQEAEAKAKAEQEKKEKKEAEKEAKKNAKEAKEKEKKEAEAKKKLEKEQKNKKTADPAKVEPAAADSAKKGDVASGTVVPADKAVLAAAGSPTKKETETVQEEKKTDGTLPRKDTTEKGTILSSIASIFKKKEGDNNFSEQKIVFVLGGPGSGKGTQCAHIKDKYKYDHISAGDLLRHEVAQDTEQGRQISEMIKDGKIVPVEITLALLRADLEKRKEAKGFLIDGFPRQIDQAVAFESALRSPDLILFFECPESILEGRLLKRGETSGRLDDNAESIRKRFQVFAEVSSKCIEHYEKEGKVKLLKVDASGEESAVWAAVQKGFSQHGME